MNYGTFTTELPCNYNKESSNPCSVKKDPWDSEGSEEKQKKRMENSVQTDYSVWFPE